MVLIGLVDIGMAFGTTLATQEPFVRIFFRRRLVVGIRRLLSGVVLSKNPEQQSGQDKESTNQPEQGAGEIASPRVGCCCHGLNGKCFSGSDFSRGRQGSSTASQSWLQFTGYGSCGPTVFIGNQQEETIL